MTQKDRELLLKDLCARLPYGVKIHTSFMGHENTEELVAINKDAMLGDYASVVVNPVEEDINDGYELENVKPYLRSMSSMTEEERDEMKRLLNPDGTGWFTAEGFVIPASHYGDMLDYSFLDDIRDYLDSKHFDHRGLIPKGLALEAKE